MYLLVDALASAYRLASSLTRSSVETSLSRPARPQRTTKPSLLNAHQTHPPQTASKSPSSTPTLKTRTSSLFISLFLSLFSFVYYMYLVRRLCCLVYSVCRGFLFSLFLSPPVSLSASCLVVEAGTRGISCCRKRQSPGDPLSTKGQQVLQPRSTI